MCVWAGGGYAVRGGVSVHGNLFWFLLTDGCGSLRVPSGSSLLFIMYIRRHPSIHQSVGHYIFKEFSSVQDGIYAFVKNPICAPLGLSEVTATWF